MIQAVIERCAGIDVGKTFIVVCVMTGAAQAEPSVEVRRFGTFNEELEDLRLWLISESCTHAVMESTGSYWKPIFNILEESIEVVLANARDVKGRKGHKTDWKDSRWLAHLLRHGMIRPSFIPERGIRELRGCSPAKGVLFWGNRTNFCEPVLRAVGNWLGGAETRRVRVARNAGDEQSAKQNDRRCRAQEFRPKQCQENWGRRGNRNITNKPELFSVF